MLYYSECQRMMERARDPERGKPLENNTRLFPRYGTGALYFAVKLHNTDVVEVHADHWIVRTGGWYTCTTRDRVYSYSPLGWSGARETSVWIKGANETSRTSSDGWWLTQVGPDNEPIPFDNAEIGADGMVTRRYWNKLAREYRARKNEASDRAKQQRIREREERRMARFAEQIRRERAKHPSLDDVTTNIVRELQTINARLTANGSR